MIDPGLVTLAFTSGVLAFFTPCSVALLPGYVGFLVSKDSGSGLWRGLKVGLAAAVGLLTVFMSIGLLVSLVGNIIAPHTFWLGTTAGVILILMGFYQIAGKHISIPVPRNLGQHTGLSAHFFFGVTYALGALGCTLPIFLLVMFQALASGGFQQGLVIFGIYSLTTATFMTITALAVVFAKDLIAKSISSVLPTITKASPYVIILAGLYLIYFQLRAFYL